MINRRCVLKIGAATTAGALVNARLFGRNVTSTEAAGIFQTAVFDERFAESHAFAAELENAGVRTSAIRGDVASLWYGRLRQRLSESRLPFVGMTDRSALFCLEELARDVQMRVIFRTDHVIEQSWKPGRQQNGLAQHTAFGPALLVAMIQNLTAKPGFGREVARLFATFDFRGSDDGAAQKRTGPFSPENRTALVSWVIA